jgi:hypothetical protein
METRKRLGLIGACLLVGVAGFGCKGGNISLTSDRTQISAGGCDKAIITATVKIGSSAASGKKVTFETTAGSFSTTEEMMSTVVTTNGEGEAVVELYATEATGTANITAYFSDENYSAEKSLTVTFGPPSGEFAPVSDSISLECEVANIGAMRGGAPEIEVPCYFSAQTQAGCSLPISAFMGGEDNLFLKAEAGSLEAIYDDWSYEMRLKHSTSGGESEPLDVDPLEGEPSRLGPLGETFNPRDGVVTLMVVVKGAEAYDDLNSNGAHDSNEPFEDLGEPFLDVDDDGVFTLGTDPYFADDDGDGEQSPANGSYDATKYISASYKIVWSGDLHEDEENGARFELSGSENIPNGGSLTVNVHALDSFLNPVAAFEDNYDYIYFNLVTGWVLVSPSSYQRTLQNVSAVSFDEKGRYLEYDAEAAAYPVTLADDDGTYTNDPPYDWQLDVCLYATPGMLDDYYHDQAEMCFQHSLRGTSQ